jgi:hypothetical protein
LHDFAKGWDDVGPDHPFGLFTFRFPLAPVPNGSTASIAIGISWVCLAALHCTEGDVIDLFPSFGYAMSGCFCAFFIYTPDVVGGVVIQLSVSQPV